MASTEKGPPMAYNLKNRSFVKEIDFDPKEMLFLLDLSAALKTAKYAGTEQPTAHRQEHRPAVREDLNQDPGGLRGRRIRPGSPRHLPRPVRIADGSQGIHGRHGPGAGTDVRRDRIPRCIPGGRRGTRRTRRCAGLQRPDRGVAPDPNARRFPHHARGQRQAVRRALLCVHG